MTDDGLSSFLILSRWMSQVRLCAYISLFLSKIAQMYSPPSSHTAKDSWLYVPVFNRVGKQADACVRVLLPTCRAGTEVVHSHIADFVIMKKDHLKREKLVLVQDSHYNFVTIMIHPKIITNSLEMPTSVSVRNRI